LKNQQCQVKLKIQLGIIEIQIVQTQVREKQNLYYPSMGMVI